MILQCIELQYYLHWPVFINFQCTHKSIPNLLRGEQGNLTPTDYMFTNPTLFKIL